MVLNPWDLYLKTVPLIFPSQKVSEDGLNDSVMLTQLLLPPIISLLHDNTDASLRHATKMGITACEERFDDLLELRMEDNLQMNAASKKEAIEGRAAVKIYKKAMESKEPFDVAILDLTNKIGIGGQETMKRLLEIDPDVKGIIITGYSDDPVVANFRAYGFSGFITKPATRDELSKVINEVISKSQ